MHERHRYCVHELRITVIDVVPYFISLVSESLILGKSCQ